jgi:DNA-binding MarR family transcriptional regulator
MPTSQSKKSAAEIAELTFQLLANCQEKEERFAEQLKIHVSEFRCLRAFRGDRSLPVKTLVERINLSGSRLTRILGSLEKRGYIQRVIDEKDRRSITVTLSKRGIELSGKLEERYLQIHEEILEGIPKDVHAPLISGLQNMLSSLQGWLKNKR